MGERNAGLDGLRGVAAVAVMFFHIALMKQRPIFTRGYLAVDLFFLLSGFVIAEAYEKRFAAGLKPPRYIWIRIKRLYPMMFVGTLVGFASYAFAQPDRVDPWIGLASGLTFVPVLTDANYNIFPLNGVQWSLFYELVANTVHGLVWPWLSTAALLAAVLVSVIALVSIDATHHGLTVGYGPHVFLEGFPRVAASFGLGLLLSRFRDRLPRFRVPLIAPLLFAFLVLAAPPVGPDSLVVLILWPLALIGALNATPRGGMEKTCRVAGAMSYPFYAVHLPLLLMGNALLNRLRSHPMKTVGWTVMVLGIFGLAWLLARFLEPGYPKGTAQLRNGPVDRAL
jgi:peptidoglycan/LPS O-acetylase OafA/YrhL